MVMFTDINYIFLAILISLRYFILTGITYFTFYKLFRLKVVELKIQQKFPKHQDFIREIKHSFLTILIFAGYGFLIFDTKFKNWTKIYDNIQEYNYLYFIASVFLAILIHDTYFYFIHRAIHHKSIFRWVHLIHHKSTNPNPFSAYSFHPLEAIIEGAVIIVIVFLIPIHKVAIAVFLLVMILFNIYGHLGYELIPEKYTKTLIGRWINTATNHNLHHEQGTNNYGLYFTFWDIIFKTLKKK